MLQSFVYLHNSKAERNKSKPKKKVKKRKEIIKNTCIVLQNFVHLYNKH